MVLGETANGCGEKVEISYRETKRVGQNNKITSRLRPEGGKKNSGVAHISGGDKDN